MMHPDETRDVEAVREAVLARFVSDPAGLREKYRGLAARDRRARRRIADLEAEVSALRTSTGAAKKELADLQRRLGAAHGALDAYRQENRRLKDDLRHVRTSTSLRVGRTVLAPLLGVRRLLERSALKSEELTVAPAANPDSGADAPAAGADAPARRAPTEKPGAGSSTQGPTGGTSARSSAPLSEIPFEVLFARFVEERSPRDFHAVLSRLWFQQGAIRRPASLLAEHPDLFDLLDTPGKALARKIVAAARLLDHGWPVPVRSAGRAMLSESDRVMYCVHSTPVFDSNGYSIRTGGVAGGLRRNGADVVVVARSGYPWDSGRRTDLPDRRRTVREQDGIEYVHNPGLGLSDSTLDQYLDEAADAFVREARLLRPSIIHAASDAHTALPALVAARRLGLPFVYEVRGLWEVTAASSREGWDRSDRYALQVALETLVATEADEVLAITPQVAEVLSARGVRPAQISLLPNAVDVDAVLPIPHDTAYGRTGHIRADVPRIGFAGSVVAYEGLDVLVEAAAILRDRGHEFAVVIAGSGAAEADLRQRVADLRLGELVHLLGRVPHDEIPRLMSTFDIMPCPRVSLPVTELVSPLKPLEAFAAGKAVVLSDVAPHRDLAGSGEERALLAAAGDATALADRLEELLRDEDRRRGLARAARLWVYDQRTWAKVCAEAIRAYGRAASFASAKSDGRDLVGLRFGLIADEFTTRTLEGSVHVVPLRRDGWLEQVENEGLDLVLLESAWKGNDGQWARAVGYYSDDEHADVRALIGECRVRGIPVVFWNKEDPVHTARFLPTAVLCDVVLTVDASLVPAYRAAGGASLRTVASLPFFAQPALHNPLRSGRPWEPTAAYAGTYYGDRYPERSRDLQRLLEAGRQVGLAIYDRQLNEPDSPYRFPDTYRDSVRGGLSYSEVVGTYGAHLAHLNVNSVPNSPTMFSRRVVEIAACGGVVLSAACRGINETLGGAVPASNDPEELSGWLDLWATDGDARRREAWHQMRAVYRAHTTTTALALVARTAGVSTRVSFPDYGLVTPALTTAVVDAVLRQSLRPTALYVGEPVDAELVSCLKRAGVVVRGRDEMTDPAGAPGWLGMLDENAGRTHYEDLTIGARIGEWDRLEPCVATDGGTGSDLMWPGHGNPPGPYGLVSAPRVRELGTLDAALLAPAERRLMVALPVAARAGAAAESLDAPVEIVRSPRRILVAGHDLKFLRAAFPFFEEAGLDVVVDEWQSHTAHDQERSRELLSSADAVLCEWGLGNAVWYSRNVREDQSLTVRVHLQELFTPHLRRIRHDNVGAYVFVSELIREAAVTSHGLPRERTLVVPNMVDTVGLDLPKTADALKSVGFVGIVPQRKRLDLALDFLEAVRVHDPAYRLVIKGKLPADFPWMQNRPREVAYYEGQFARIEQMNAAQPGSVELVPHGPDMADWYRTVGTVLSVSDFESFHLTIADGVASGALPAILHWPGADLIWPREWISASVEELASRVARREPLVTPSAVAHMAQSCVARQLLDVIAGAGRGK